MAVRRRRPNCFRACCHCSRYRSAVADHLNSPGDPIRNFAADKSKSPVMPARTRDGSMQAQSSSLPRYCQQGVLVWPEWPGQSGAWQAAGLCWHCKAHSDAATSIEMPHASEIATPRFAMTNRNDKKKLGRPECFTCSPHLPARVAGWARLNQSVMSNRWGGSPGRQPSSVTQWRALTVSWELRTSPHVTDSTRCAIIPKTFSLSRGCNLTHYAIAINRSQSRSNQPL